MHAKSTPTMARGVSNRMQFDSENKGEHLKRKLLLYPSQWALTLVKYMAYSPSEGASKSKTSPTDALEFDTFEGTRSQLSDTIRL